MKHSTTGLNREKYFGCTKPFIQEVPYGTKKSFNGVKCVYMPDPWTHPIGYGNAWCSIQELEKDGIKYPDEPNYRHRLE
jgi:hypothetical protein